MFSNTIDNKKTYTIDDDIEVVDLADSIFEKGAVIAQSGSLLKVTKEYEMRPDLISKVLYGTEDYTEMILKYSCISNPFALEADDVIYEATLTSILNPIKEEIVNSDKISAAVKAYHKYIDKKKVPTSSGSEKNTKEIIKSDTEANISKTGDTGISIVNGKIYFGDVDPDLKTADSSLVDCATNGTTLGQFITAVLRNG